MRLVTLAVAVVLLAAAPAAAQDPVDDTAEALRDDPVYVDPQAENALTDGEAADLRDRIDGELFVAVLPESAGSADELAAALRSQLGGSVAVVAGDSFRVDGTARAEAVSYTHLTLPTTPYV